MKDTIKRMKIQILDHEKCLQMIYLKRNFIQNIYMNFLTQKQGT